MANPEHLAKLKEGVEAWNAWRKKNPKVEVDLSGFSFMKRDLSEINLSGVDLTNSDFFGTRLIKSDLSGAHLERANFSYAKLSNSNFTRANLSNSCLTNSDISDTFFSYATLRSAKLENANLHAVDLSYANLSSADLKGANLEYACLVKSNLEGANLTGARIFGISAWNLNLNNTQQRNLIITTENEPTITVDDLELAQFIYLLLNNKKIRNVIDTIGKKGVLILGRFSPERKVVLDAIRNSLRTKGFVPMMFDFEKPTQRDFTETIKTLAGLSRFIIADITNPKSSPLELQATMPDYMIPFVPIIQENEEPFSMFRDLKQKYEEWVLDVLKYDSVDNLLKVIDKAIIEPALKMGDKLLIKKTEEIKSRHVSDYFEKS